ncbi:MAG: hypothetical protein IJT03_08485 [Clostridia bacterium]|nr:hypothetical protein [Clostridia bacterium]
MKQSKRLLCVLLTMLLILGTMTVGVSAYKTSYQYPEGYDSVNQPYFTNEQAASALLDYIDDEVLAGVNLHKSILDIDIDIYSLDSAFDSVDDIFSSYTYKIGQIADLGDIEDMNWSIPRNGNNRRRSASMSDFEFMAKFLEFLQVNYNYLYKWADNSFDLGLIASFWDPREEVEMLNDLHGYINEIAYKALIDDAGTGFNSTTATLDSTIQEFINNRCVKFICDMLAKSDGTNAVADFLNLPTNKDGTLKNQMGLLQLCPSLTAADINITTVSTYNLISNIFNAFLNDIVMPLAGGLILDALKIKPDDTSADTSYINIAIEYFVKNETVGLPADNDDLDAKVAAFLTMQGVENPTQPKPIDKVNATLDYILGDGIRQYVYFQDDGQNGEYLKLDQELVDNIANYIKIGLPMLGELVSDLKPMTSEQAAALENMNQEATFAFAAQYLLDNLVDGVRFSKNCSTIKELATYTLVNVAAELVPDIDFEAKIASHEIDPNSDQCLDIAAVIIRYYLVGELGVVIPDEEPTFVELLNYSFDHFLGKYATLFNVYPTASDKQTYQNNVWYKIYMSANQWIPFTNILYGIEDSWAGVQELVMDKLLDSVLDFNIQNILSLFGRRPDSDLQKPLSQVIVNLLARVINGVFKLAPEKSVSKTDNNAQKNNLIIPYSYTKLDQLIVNVISSSDANNGCGLKNTANRLLYYITNITGEDSLCAESLDLVAELMGVLKLKDFDFMKMKFIRESAGSNTHSITQLRELYNENSLEENETLKYYEEGYRYFHMVDFAPYLYLEYRAAVRDANDIIMQYDSAKKDPETFTFPSRAEITYAYYALENYHNLLIENQETTSDYQFNKIYTEATAAGLTNRNPDGTQKYTDRSWAAYQHAIDFANTVKNEYAQYVAQGITSDYRQSKINEARRQLIDALDGLKSYIGLADYTNLDIAINRLPTLRNPRFFSEESVKNVLEAYKDAINTDRDYDLDDQDIVDAAYNELTDAIANLETVPCIDLVNPEEQFIDNDYNFIYGFHEDFYNEEDAAMWDDYFYDYFYDYGIASEGYVGLVPTSLGNGTGSKIQLIIDPGDGTDQVSSEYTLIIFGDINGDSMINAEDSVLMRAYAAFMLDAELSPEYITYAGDLNNDGNLGTSDAKTCENAGVGKANISQAPDYCTSKEFTFLNLLGN